MKKTTALNSIAATSILAAAVLLTSNAAMAGKPGMEKCLGVAKAGMNDCGANGHTCAGHAKTDADANEWVYVPEGSCEKIVGSLGVKAPKAES